MNDAGVIVAMGLAALAGGLVVYVFFAMRPTAWDQPVERYVAGCRIEQVSGTSVARPRVLAALAALVVCALLLAVHLGAWL